MKIAPALDRHSSLVDVRRRGVLKAGGLSIAFFWLGGPGRANAMMNARAQDGDGVAAAHDGNAAFAPNAFIRIDPTGPVRLIMPAVEMGQGIYTGASMLIAEELGVGMDQIRVEHSPPNADLYGNPLIGGQITGGSTSMRASWQVLREAGAVARTQLVAAAAAQWRVEPTSCTTARGVVSHEESRRAATYGSLATAAGKLPMPSKVQLKELKDHVLIGKPVRRVDSVDKIKGATQFGIDVRLPGMKIATVRASPAKGGRLKSVDERATRAIPGVIAVLKIDDAVAVVGEHFWAAKQGLDALNIEWDNGPNAKLTTQNIRNALADQSKKGKAIVAREVGSKPDGKLIEAIYQLPMLAHATMEPLNATVHVTTDGCEIWTGTQVPTRCVDLAAKVTGIPVEKITLHNQYLGGGFGRRLEEDIAGQAAAFAKQVPYPLKVIWTREEDMRHDIVRPMYHDQISAVVDANGRPVWFGDRITGASVLARFAPVAMRKNGIDPDLVECVEEIPYDIPNLKVEWVRHDMPEGLLVGWWRGVGPTHNLFVFESFIDELAHAAGKDPLAYRRSLLQKNPRTRAVLDLAAEKIGWDKQPLGSRIGRGIAVGEPFGSVICAIVEVEVSAQGQVKLRRAVVTVDCGVVVNPNTVEAQLQGGLLFGLSSALFSEVTIKDGAYQQSNFNDYRVLRINETPPVEVYCIDSTRSPGGLGEPGTAIAAPALGNAIFAATGVRLRSLPVDRKLLVQSPDALKKVVQATSDGEQGAA
jgi:isoquinoline 1-oxidoreductase beta subunit